MSIKFGATIAACRKYAGMPCEFEGTIDALRSVLINATGAMHFSVRGYDRRVTVRATGELIGYIDRDPIL